MNSTTITVKDTATPMLDNLSSQLANARPLFARLGKFAEGYLRAHFATRESQPNKRGWPKQHIWARIRSATALREVSDNDAVVSIASPEFAHKLDPQNPVTPKRGKMLAIPLTAEAYAAGSPREGVLQGLFVWKRKGASRRGSGVFLAQRDGKALRVQYALLPQVSHAADPNALPDMDKMAETLVLEAKVAVGELISKGNVA
jgi:hypothetical protein